MITIYEFGTTEGKSGTLAIDGYIENDELEYVKERVTHLISVGMLVTHDDVMEEARANIDELGYNVLPHEIVKVDV